MMKEPTHKAFLAESDRFRQSLAGYIESRNSVDEHNELSYRIIDAINEKSKSDKDLRNEAYKYFTCVKGYSTIKLREICKGAGFDFWASLNSNGLAESNAINTIDTAHIHHAINRYKGSFTLQKRTACKVEDGNVFLQKNHRGITAGNFVDTYYKEKGYNLTMTQLYRVNFKDKEMCTTWVQAGLNPVTIDILAIELNYRYVAVIADLGDAVMPVGIDFRGDGVVVTQVYQDYDRIKQAAYYQLQAVCDAVAARFEDSRDEMSALKK